MVVVLGTLIKAKMNILEIVSEIKKDDRCIVTESLGIPQIFNDMIIPEDLKVFYKNCGGIIFFKESEYPFEIFPPSKIQRANPIILGQNHEDDISFHWFLIGKNEEQFISIDLSKEKSGRCYDSFWDVHSVSGSQPIVANSFTDLLIRFFFNQGNYWYWLDKNFIKIGDAYD
jgi:antitoxin YokJ